MNAPLWVTVLLCWGIAALLVVSLAYPDFSMPKRRERHVAGTQHDA